MVGIRVDVNLHLETIRGRLDDFEGLVHRLVTAVLLRQQSVAESYMRGAAPWTDRTGNARSGLHAVAAGSGAVQTLTLSHGVAYGIWLEVRYGGRYAVVGPSLLPQGQQVMALLDRGMARM